MTVYTAAKLLTCALELSQLPAGPWPRGALGRYRRLLAEALGCESEAAQGVRGGLLVHGRFDGRGPAAYTAKDFLALQADVSKLMRLLAAQRAARPVVATTIHQLTIVPMPYRDRSLLLVRGAVRDVFLFLILHAATQTSNRAIGRCPVCLTLFVRKGKKRYCDRPCTNKASAARWVRRHGPGAARLAKRRSYERRVAPARPRSYAPRRQA